MNVIYDDRIFFREIIVRFLQKRLAPRTVRWSENLQANQADARDMQLREQQIAQVGIDDDFFSLNQRRDVGASVVAQDQAGNRHSRARKYRYLKIRNLHIALKMRA